MRILALDTSTPRGSVALLEGGAVVAELRSQSQETHSARLLSGIEFLLNTSGWQLADLQLIAVGIGPGSFTGIRIGVATALGLAQTLSIPYAGISCLDAVAEQVAWIEGSVGVVMDAQRDEVYYCAYEAQGGKIRKLSRPALLDPGEVSRQLSKTRVSLVGDGVLRCFQSPGRRRGGWPRLVEIDLFLASALGRLAMRRKRSWKSGAFLQSNPLYIRLPDALRRKAKQR